MTLRHTLSLELGSRPPVVFALPTAPLIFVLHQLAAEARGQALRGGGGAARPEAGHGSEPVSLTVALLTHKSFSQTVRVWDIKREKQTGGGVVQVFCMSDIV